MMSILTLCVPTLCSTQFRPHSAREARETPLPRLHRVTLRRGQVVDAPAAAPEAHEEDLERWDGLS